MPTFIPAVEMRNITKRFPGVVANDAVSLTAYKGEIHALLGENGAGKSTLMNTLTGLYQPDAGEILVNGKPVDFRSPRDAIRAGIGMIHQHFMLTPSQTVAENIVLGSPGLGFVLNPTKIEREIGQLGEQVGLPVDPRAKVWHLSVGEQQRVEILKMLYRGAEILILDEPTAVLTPQESDVLFQTLQRMRSQGKTIIFISHKLEEVLATASQITILRRGRVVATVPAQGMTRNELARLMVGREVFFQIERKPAQPGEPGLVLRQIEALDDKQLPALRGLSLTVRAGEIVAIAGVAGNGQRELTEVISGLRRPSAGVIEIAGRPIPPGSPAAAIAAGVAFIPEDRRVTGSAPNLSIAENLALKQFRGPLLGRGWWIDRRRMAANAARLVQQYAIASPGVTIPVRKLSGGNLQKVILAREISSQPQVLVAAYPTRGLDIGATEQVRRLLVAERDRGAAILLLSEDLEEILLIADRIAVIYEGQIVGEVRADQAEVTALGLMMAGARPEEGAL